eukprot:TRINITY_DN2145_c0_g1_i1.p1 TRINITY_DN2145_c0_g1~~TRINITY_DN2145_c0_g1_i1.p1  ORF type:complete len:143 (+),score=7.61 TRINITY_DN2145_c0_g1_i1:89-517(+)
MPIKFLMKKLEILYRVLVPFLILMLFLLRRPWDPLGKSLRSPALDLVIMTFSVVIFEYLFQKNIKRRIFALLSVFLLMIIRHFFINQVFNWGNVMEKQKKLKQSVLFAVIWSISTSVLAFLTFEQNVKKILAVGIMSPCTLR